MRESSKGEIMPDNKVRFWEPVIRVRGRTSGRTRLLLQWMALLLLIVSWCVPAAAQCDAFVAQNASNSVWVINTLTDTAVAGIPGGFFPFWGCFTPHGGVGFLSKNLIIIRFFSLTQPPPLLGICTAR